MQNILCHTVLYGRVPATAFLGHISCRHISRRRALPLQTVPFGQGAHCGEPKLRQKKLRQKKSPPARPSPRGEAPRAARPLSGTAQVGRGSVGASMRKLQSGSPQAETLNRKPLRRTVQPKRAVSRKGLWGRRGLSYGTFQLWTSAPRLFRGRARLSRAFSCCRASAFQASAFWAWALQV
jgi:hypothetical protein